MNKRNHISKLKTILCISLSLNIIFGGFIGYKFISKIDSSFREYNYLSNPQYTAELTTFNLNKEKNADVIFLGDSLTLFGKYDEFFPDIRSLNRGIGSDTTEGVLNRLDEIISRNPNKIFIMIGINDLGRNMSVQNTSKNMYQILRKLHDNTTASIYVESVLPTSTIDCNAIQNLNENYRQICQKTSTHYIDLYKRYINGGGRYNEPISLQTEFI